MNEAKTNEATLDLITSIMDCYINKKTISEKMCLAKIQSTIEESYIHGSLDNNYK